MFRSIAGRLDRRWKRLAVVLWLPLLLLSFILFVAALVNIYFVLYAKDEYVLGCHYEIVRQGGVTIADVHAYLSDKNSEEDQRRRAFNRYQSRYSVLSPYSDDARQVERSAKFIGCISRTPSASWWLNYQFAWPTIITLFILNALIALIVFPRFWRTLGAWIAMRN